MSSLISLNITMLILNSRLSSLIHLLKIYVLFSLLSFLGSGGRIVGLLGCLDVSLAFGLVFPLWVSATLFPWESVLGQAFE